MSGFTLADALATWDAIDAEVRAELARAHDLHGGQHLPSGCGPDEAPLLGLDVWPQHAEEASAEDLRKTARESCTHMQLRGDPRWSDVAIEETFELLAENPDTDPAAWRAEGVQVICTVVRAMTDQRTSEGDRA